MPPLYESLQSWQTRLIRLLPGFFDDPIRCDLLVADVILESGVGIPSLCQTVEYEAISYSWGWSKRTASVICNNQAVFVTPTLKDAIWHLRRHDEERWLWCDALCINQEDSAEKSRQVQMMINIFSKAKGVVAWLGLPENKELGSAFSKLVFSPNDQLRQSEHAAIEVLIQRPWFSRTCVRQEVFAAAKLDIQLGHMNCSWSTFSRLFDEIRDCIPTNLRTLLEDYSTMEPVFPTGLLRYPTQVLSESTLTGALCFDEEARGAYIRDLLSILLRNKHFQVSDERDRVYGLLGLLQNKTAGSFATMPVDYTHTVAQVYEAVARFLINVTRSLEVLLVFRPHRDDCSLASWVIDWGADYDETFLSMAWNWRMHNQTKFAGYAESQRFND